MKPLGIQRWIAMRRPFVLFCCHMALAMSSSAGELDTTGLVSGKVTRSKDRVIIEGATFVLAPDDKLPAIWLDKDAKQEVIISSSRIISNGQTIADHTGDAGIVVIDNGDSGSKVTMRNVRVYARNANVSSASTGNDVCAGISCIRRGAYDSYRSISVRSAGKTQISASQGMRPDYRRLPRK